MNRKALIIAAMLFAGVFCFKALFPGAAANIIDGVAEIFSRDIDYREVLTNIGDGVPVFSSDGNEEKSLGIAVEATAETEQAAVGAGEKLSDEAVNCGEEADVNATAIPAAVIEFLESQQQYSDVELPGNVSYDYEPFPEDICVPVAGYNSSGFGYRTHPIHGDLRFHYGTDFAAWSGENIYAFADGTVTLAAWSESYGNYITVEHPGGWESLYAHCSILYVETGDEVKAGQKIALVGDTGLVTGPHLHFELMHNGVYTNPEYYVN